MNKTILDTVLGLDQLDAVAAQLLKATDERVFLFDAGMGAGKTTMIKAMCKALGSTDPLSSPTYSIVNEYSYPGGRIFHFDLYRVKRVEELLDAGIEEYLDSGEYCFIEWPALAEDLVEGSYVNVKIGTNAEGRRLKAVLVRN